MGLGLKLHVPHEALGGRTWAEVRNAVETFAADPGDPLLAQVFRADPDDGVLHLVLHPAEEPVVFYPDSTGALTVQGGSAVAGPGFHAYLVGWLEDLGRALDLPWRSDGPDAGDATGYLDHRDFDALQAEHAVALAALARALVPHLRARTGDPARAPPWPLGRLFGCPMPARSPHGLISCLGDWDEGYFEALAAADEDACQALAARFYPWWEAGTGAGFWDGVARCLAWSRVAWRPARTAADRALYQLVLDAFARAQDLDPARAAPAAEVAELRRLLSDAAEDRPPSPDGIGFRRREVLIPVGAGWRIRLPGYFHEAFEDEGTTGVYWFGDRTVRVGSWSADDDDGAPRPAAALVAHLDPPEDAVWRRDGDLVAFAVRTRAPGDGDGGACPTVDGRAAVAGSLCATTICYTDPADEAWALGVFESLTHR